MKSSGSLGNTPLLLCPVHGVSRFFASEHRYSDAVALRRAEDGTAYLCATCFEREFGWRWAYRQIEVAKSPGYRTRTISNREGPFASLRAEEA